MKEFDSGSGAAVADPSIEDAQFVNMDIALIVPSLSNRHDFDADKLQGLANNIKARGVRFPIVVRPLPGSRLQETFAVPHDPNKSFGANLDRKKMRPTHEIVSGERRYHASLIAGKTTIPAIVRNTDDETSLEDQLIENLQREDLSDLQEAEGYERLMALSNLTVDQVAEKLSLGRSYVYSHLKLLDLTSDSKKALKTGEIDYSRALLIARIPNAKLQEKAVKAATEKHQYTGATVSLREFQTWLRQNVMLRLDTAPFQITDVALVPAAGSCKECPKRTGANPDLFAEVDGADICTDPVCYADKAKTHRSILVAKAEAKGMRVIEGKEAKGIVSQYSSTLKGYSRLDQKRADISTDAPTLKKLLGPDVAGKVLIEDPHSKELIEAIPTEEAEALLVTKGLLTAVKAKSSGTDKLTQEIENLRQKMTYNLASASRLAIFQTLGKKIHGTKDDKVQALVNAQLLRAYLQGRFDSYDLEAGDDEWAVITNEPVPEGKDGAEVARAMVDTASLADLWRIFATFTLLDDSNAYHGPKPSFEAMAKTLRVDLKAVEQKTKETMREEVNAQIKALRAEAATAKKSIPPQTPLAQPKTLAKNKNPAGAGAKKGTKPGRLSPEDAQLGIALAMQGVEGEAAATASLPVSTQPGTDTPTDKAKPSVKAKKAATDTAVQQSEATGSDPLLAKAITAITKAQKVSVRLLKTELGVGQTKAVQLIADLEAAGKISAPGDQGVRTVLA